MGIWERVIERFRLREILPERPDEDETESKVLSRPPPTPTTRVPERPHETPTAHPREIGGETAGTPSYGSPKGTPSTQRLHNPKHFR